MISLSRYNVFNLNTFLIGDENLHCSLISCFSSYELKTRVIFSDRVLFGVRPSLNFSNFPCRVTVPTGPLVHQTWHNSPLGKNYTSSLHCFLSWGYNLELLKGLHPLKVFSKSNSPEKLNLVLKHHSSLFKSWCPRSGSGHGRELKLT